LFKEEKTRLNLFANELEVLPQEIIKLADLEGLLFLRKL